MKIILFSFNSIVVTAVPTSCLLTDSLLELKRQRVLPQILPFSPEHITRGCQKTRFSEIKE